MLLATLAVSLPLAFSSPSGCKAVPGYRDIRSSATLLGLSGLATFTAGTTTWSLSYARKTPSRNRRVLRHVGIPLIPLGLGSMMGGLAMVGYAREKCIDSPLSSGGIAWSEAGPPPMLAMSFAASSIALGTFAMYFHASNRGSEKTRRGLVTAAGSLMALGILAGLVGSYSLGRASYHAKSRDIPLFPLGYSGRF